MNRRDLLKGLAAGGIIVAGELWIPGQRLISIPKPLYGTSMAEIMWPFQQEINRRLKLYIGDVVTRRDRAWGMCHINGKPDGVVIADTPQGFVVATLNGNTYKTELASTIRGVKSERSYLLPNARFHCRDKANSPSSGLSSPF